MGLPICYAQGLLKTILATSSARPKACQVNSAIHSGNSSLHLTLIIKDEAYVPVVLKNVEHFFGEPGDCNHAHVPSHGFPETLRESDITSLAPNVPPIWAGRCLSFQEKFRAGGPAHNSNPPGCAETSFPIRQRVKNPIFLADSSAI